MWKQSLTKLFDDMIETIIYPHKRTNSPDISVLKSFIQSQELPTHGHVYARFIYQANLANHSAIDTGSTMTWVLSFVFILDLQVPYRDKLIFLSFSLSDLSLSLCFTCCCF